MRIEKRRVWNPWFFGLAVGLGLVAGPGPSVAAEVETNAAAVGRHIERVQQAYFDLLGQYPAFYTCEMQSPELVASLDPKGRQAWGDGHVLLTRTPEGLQLIAEGLAKPAAAPWFNIALGLWQLQLGTHLKVLEAHLPAALTAIAVGVVAAPLTHRAFKEREGELIRLSLRARKPDHGIQELRLELTADDELRGIAVRNRNGGGVNVRFASRRSPSHGNRWLVTGITATIEKPGQATEVVAVELDYATAGGPQPASVLGRLAIRRQDVDGRLLRRNAQDVNPISFRFSNCWVVPADLP